MIARSRMCTRFFDWTTVVRCAHTHISHIQKRKLACFSKHFHNYKWGTTHPGWAPTLWAIDRFRTPPISPVPCGMHFANRHYVPFLWLILGKDTNVSSRTGNYWPEWQVVGFTSLPDPYAEPYLQKWKVDWKANCKYNTISSHHITWLPTRHSTLKQAWVCQGTHESCAFHLPWFFSFSTQPWIFLWNWLRYHTWTWLIPIPSLITG